MGRRYAFVGDSDTETEYSESDLSMLEYPRRRHSVHRRSVSRHRHHAPEYSSTTHLQPIVQGVHLHRSASTGARRRRDPDRPPQPPAVIVDVRQDSHTAATNKQRRQQQEYVDPFESDDETQLRKHHRPRASTSSISREASPRAPAPPGRDYDLIINQRLLERSDARQDLELLKQQQEIERLERELARHKEHQQQQLQHREHSQTRPIVVDDGWYEDDLSERLHRLDRLERKQRAEEEQRRAEQRHKLRQWEEEQRKQHEEEEVKMKMHERKLRELQQKIEEEEERERIRKEIRDQEAREAFEKAEKERKEAMMKHAAIEEWKLNEEKRKIAEREAKKKADEEFKNRLRSEFGYSEEELEKLLKKKDDKEKGKDKDKEKGKEKKDDKDDGKEEDDHHRTWIKVHRKYLLPDTLMAYQLPWDWDERDRNYIIIKQWITEDMQEELFAHTRRIREGKLVTQTSSSQTELRVRDGRKDKLYLVRKKSPSRRAFLFT
ncbi:hypothetical protein BDV59DRAFT_171242 [Aspergillus ambiguus]|uniref:uncharacterized protein n=1 Tax=Aspergillus ambiguus TaxID=176160 RepID=UPI003CCE3696